MDFAQIINLLGGLLSPAIIAFYFLDTARFFSVKGSEQRYRLTGIVWTLVWPAYACAIVWLMGAIIEHSAFMLFVSPLHILFVAYRHRRLKNDDDDNPWRKLKRKLKSVLKSAIRRARSVRIPQLAPPALAPGAA